MRAFFEKLRRIPERHWFYLLLLFGITLRFFYLWSYSSSLLFDCAVGPDVHEYYERAIDILNGEILSTETEYHAPLYSFFLAGTLYLTGGSIPLVRIIQLLLNFGGWVLIFQLLRRSPGIPRKVSWTFLTLGMLYPVPFFHQSQLVSETLLLPLLAICLYFLFRSPGRENGKFLLPAGLFAGLAGITHPLTLAFAGFLFLSFCFKRKFRRALLFAVGCAIPVLPVSICAGIGAERPVLVQAGGGFNFYLGNNPDATGGCYLRPGAEWDRVHAEAALEANQSGRNSDSVFLEKSFRFLTQHPFRALALFGKKAFLAIHPRELISGADPEALILETPLLKYGILFTLPIFALAAAGICYGWRRRNGYYGLFYLLFFSMWAAQILTVCAGRYRTMMIPAVLFFAAVAITRLKTRYVFTVLLACALFAVWLYPATPRELGEAASLRGEAAYRKGEFDRAKQYLEYAAQHIDAPARFENLLGSIAARTGNHAEAERRFRRLTELAPQLPDGWMNLANLLAADPARRSDAEEIYRAALKLTPQYADLHYNYALLLQQEKRLDEASAEFAEALRLLPGHAGAANGLGSTAFLAGKPEEAIRFFELAHRLEPDNPHYLGNLVIALRAAGKEAEAKALESKSW